MLPDFVNPDLPDLPWFVLNRFRTWRSLGKTMNGGLA